MGADIGKTAEQPMLGVLLMTAEARKQSMVLGKRSVQEGVGMLLYSLWIFGESALYDTCAFIGPIIPLAIPNDCFHTMDEDLFHLQHFSTTLVDKRHETG